MHKKLLLSFMLIFSLLIPANNVLAADEEERQSQKYEENRYELMTYSDDAWYDFMGKSGSEMMDFIKNSLWALNRTMASFVLMIVYQLFSLDIVEMTKSSVQNITSSTAGALTYNFGLFALAVASIGIVVRSYIQQDWRSFMKLLSLILISLSLLYSIQSEKFNYIELSHGLSITLENTLMQANPSLSQDGAFEFVDFDNNSARDVSIAVENKVFNALIYQPYLLLNYGTSDEEAIKAEDPERIDSYLSADPATEDGAESRAEIEEEEFNNYNNQSIFAGNAYKQMGYIMIMMISTIIQGVVFFFIALTRIMLQFAFIIMMLLVPIILFVSLFPSFESLVGKFTKGTFMVIVFKGITMFFVLVATSFITLGYDMTNFNDDVYYRMFIQIIFSVAILFLYMKRQFVFNMLEGASPNLSDMGAAEGMGRGTIRKGKRFLNRQRQNKAYKGMNKANKKKRVLQEKGLQGMSAGKASFQNTSSLNDKPTASGRNIKGTIKDKAGRARDHIRAVQEGEIPSQKENPYHNDAVIQNVSTNEATEKTKEAVGSNYMQHPSGSVNSTQGARNPRQYKSGFKSNKNHSLTNQKTADKKNVEGNTKAYMPSAGVTAKKVGSSANQNVNQSVREKYNIRKDKPITKWEAQQQIKDNQVGKSKANKVSSNQQTIHPKQEKQPYKRSGRNPYQSRFTNYQSNNKSTSKRRQNKKPIGSRSEEGLLNRTSRLHKDSDQ
ncbi:CD3337/EF1877 family mobilome membrane protein [Thalassobacillus sp. B23F22_16]|uniref:CD3337/EF1877 family mobilome membrane protein n=1 Tax=Thalassobacillus sp. B23F22_16 TaxID=3459513 RepID=UPI00373E2068